MPSNIKDYDDQIKNLLDQEEAASGRNDFEEAAKLKSERLGLHKEMISEDSNEEVDKNRIVDSEQTVFIIIQVVFSYKLRNRYFLSKGRTKILFIPK